MTQGTGDKTRLPQVVTLLGEAASIISKVRKDSSLIPNREDMILMSAIEEKSHKLWLAVCDLESEFFARFEESPKK